MYFSDDFGSFLSDWKTFKSLVNAATGYTIVAINCLNHLMSFDKCFTKFKAKLDVRSLFDAHFANDTTKVLSLHPNAIQI